MTRLTPLRRSGRGFTLVEILVVLAILGVLIALLMPAVQAAREAARRAGCGDHLRQMGIALHAYHDAVGAFPPGYVAVRETNPLQSAPGWGWASRILPELEARPLFDSINFDLPVADPANETSRTAQVAAFVCPADVKTGPFYVLRTDRSRLTDASSPSYAACFGQAGDPTDDPEAGDGLFVRNLARRIAEVTDGTSATIALGDRGSILSRAPWAGVINGAALFVTPGIASQSQTVRRGAYQVLAQVGIHPLNSTDSDPADFFGPHPGGAQFLLADGSSRFLRSTIDPNVFRALASRSGGEVISAEGIW